MMTFWPFIACTVMSLSKARETTASLTPSI